jgi:hypothetical protein
MQIQSSNSRIRVVSVHAVDDPGPLIARLTERQSRGELKRSFDLEWKDGVYRFGGDWLTGQAFELINLGAEDPRDLGGRLQQFELSTVAEVCSDVAFGYFQRGAPKYSPALAVKLHKAGLVFSGTSVVLVWIDISLESASPEAWLDLLGVLHKREGGDYLLHFVDSSGVRCSHSDLMKCIENDLLGSVRDVRITHSARNLHRFSRIKLMGGSREEASAFLRATVGADATAEEESCVLRQGHANIRWAWGMHAVSGVFVGDPEGRERGAVQFQNSFHFADRWLAHVICLLQFHLMIELERGVVRTMASSVRMRSLRNPARVLIEVVRMKKSYESMMDTFMDSYWKLGLIQIHSEGGRHLMFRGLQQKLGLEETVSRFHDKLTTLGSFLAEKQKGILGWFLVYVPFVSLMIGLLSINVRGWTSDEGLSPAALTGLLIVVTASYIVALAATRVLFAGRSRKS